MKISFLIYFMIMISIPCLGYADDANELIFRVDDFSLPDQSGRIHQLSRKINSRFIVFYSYSIGCPIARKNLPSLRKLKTEFNLSDAVFYYIDSSKQDTRQLITEETIKFDLPFPVLIDETQEIARLLKINRTAEAIVIDTKSSQIVFRGPVDDQQQYASEKRKAVKEYLKTALRSLLKGKKIKEKYVRSLGCALTIHPRKEVTYYKDVAPILKQKCSQCHETIGNPPNNFFTFSDAKNWSAMIKEVVRTELMPPWEVDPEIHVSNQSMLTVDEKETLYSWIETGMREGKREEYVEPGIGNAFMSYVEDKDLDSFNHAYKMKAPVTIKADGIVNWHYELIEVNNDEEYWINSFALDSVLSHYNIVQHALLIVAREDLPNIGETSNEFLPYETFKKIYSVITLSNQNRIIASNYSDKAYRIPKGARVYLQVHFAKTGRDETAQIKLLVKKFKKQGNLKEILYDARASLSHFEIPPNVDSHVLSQKIHYFKDVVLFRVAAHMHWRGKHARLYLIEPGKGPKLIYNARFIFKNRRTYDFKEPVYIKAGSTLRAELEYDNSKGNPAGIDFNKKVGWGEDAYSGEMMLMHLFYYRPDQ